MSNSDWPLMLDGEPTSIRSAAKMPRTRVLVVEADAAVRRNLVQTLIDARYLASAAGDAAQALHLLDLERYDVVVIDEDLPGICGGELARRIRAWPARWDVGLIALTTDPASEIAFTLLEADCDACLAKAEATAELTALVGQVARKRSKSAAARHGGHTIAA